MVTNLHVYLKCPMTKQSILSICKLIELLKMVRLTMQEYATEIFNTTLCLSQYQIHQALLIIDNSKVCFKKKVVESFDWIVYDFIMNI